MSAPSTNKISDISQTASNQDTDSGPSRAHANISDSVSSHEGSLDVFKELVDSPDDFLGMMAYSLYKQHKIEWLRSHPQDDHQAFKKVACTTQQVQMYRNQAEQLTKNFIDVTLETLGEEMRQSILAGEIMTRMNSMEPALTSKIDALKPSKSAAFISYMLGGLCSAIVAILLFGLFSLYDKFQKEGGLEGRFKENGPISSVENTSTPPAPTLTKKSTPAH